MSLSSAAARRRSSADVESSIGGDECPCLSAVVRRRNSAAVNSPISSTSSSPACRCIVTREGEVGLGRAVSVVVDSCVVNLRYATGFGRR
jgi:hypothetical protein